MVLVKKLDIIFSLIENASHDCMEMEIISFKINECGFNDTSTWPAWLFFGDDHVIWMRPVVTSSKVNSFPWLLFCKSSFVINRLKYACVRNYHDHTRRQLILVASLILTEREERHRSALKSVRRRVIQKWPLNDGGGACVWGESGGVRS